MRHVFHGKEFGHRAGKPDREAFQAPGLTTRSHKLTLRDPGDVSQVLQVRKVRQTEALNLLGEIQLEAFQPATLPSGSGKLSVLEDPIALILKVH
jgi:hypothetical protein